MQLKLAICRKEGTTNYGSNGASAEISIELDPDFSIEMIGQVSALWHQALTAAVDSQLARMRTVPPAPAPADRQPEPEYIPRRQRDDQNGRTAPPAPRPINPNMLRNDGGPWRGSGPPADGRQLLGFARRRGLDKALLDLGAAWHLPARVVDWSPEDVAEAYDTLSGTAVNGSANGNGNGRSY